MSIRATFRGVLNIGLRVPVSGSFWAPKLPWLRSSVIFSNIFYWFHTSLVLQAYWAYVCVYIKVYFRLQQSLLGCQASCFPNGPIYNKTGLVQIIAWHRAFVWTNGSPVFLHIYVTQPQWVKCFEIFIVNMFHIDGLVQDCSISIANALEILQSCTKPSI